jgi:hypothetical protein
VATRYAVNYLAFIRIHPHFVSVCC